MQLSIGMMVKNEEKYLDQCLTSLHPVLDNLDAELIIVDTGSDDSTVEIAKKHTDRVYFHQWNNNFSEMRNKVIGYARGEWYLSIDGDEIVENPRTIINFFRSDKHKNFNTGLIKIKNLFREDDKSKFAEFNAPRLFKNDKDFHFEGAVHNQPQYKGPIIKLPTTLIHYGYISTDEDLMERKFNRTSKILKAELEKDPGNIYYRYQLAVSYGMYKNFEQALSAIRKAYKLVKENDKPGSYMYVLTYFAKMLIVNKKYNETEELCEEALKLKDGYIDLYFYLASARMKLKKYDKARESFLKYLELVDAYNNGNKQVDSSNIIYTLGDIDYAHYYLSVIFMKKEQYKKVLKFAKKIKDSKIARSIYEKIINSYFELEDYDGLSNYYHNYVSEENRKVFLGVLEKINLSRTDPIKFAGFFTDEENNYGLLSRFRIMIEDGKEADNTILDLISELDFNELPKYYADIIYYLLINKKSISNYINDLQESVFQKYLNYLLEKYNEDFIIVTYQYLMSNELVDLSIKTAKIFKSLGKTLILSNGLDEEKYRNVFKNYINIGTYYINSVYTDQVINNEKIFNLKNNEEIFLLFMFKAEKIKDKDRVNYIKYLRKALDVYPVMKKGIEFILDKINNESPDFRDEQSKIKSQIENLINNNQLAAAKELVVKYEEIIQNDIDIFTMKSVIAIMESDFGRAKNIIKNGLEVEKNNADLLYNLAYIYEVEGNKSDAHQLYRKIIKITEDDDLINEIKEKLDKVNNQGSNSINIEKNSKKEISSVELDKEIADLFKNQEYEEIIDRVKKLNSLREYREIISIGEYWLDKVSTATGLIYFFMGTAFNGLQMYDKAMSYHKKALKYDKKLADIKNGKSIYQKKYDEYKTKCLSCNSSGYKIINVSNQSISENNREIINPLRIWVKCKKCGLIYANPIPSEKSLNQYYSIIAEEKFGGIYGDIDNRFEFLVNLSNTRLAKIEKYIKSGRKLLDIGAGVGIFAGTAENRGWDVTGLELTEEDCLYAKKNYNIDLIQENFYNVDWDRQFDVITLFEVIEHLREPDKALFRINKMLKDDGLFVLATPILDSLYGRKTKEKNVFWNVVTHLTYFDKQVLSELLEKNGFKIIEINMSKEGMGRMEFYCKKIY